MDHAAPDFFGSEADIAALEAARASGTAGAVRRIELAWYRRQRDTRAALALADAAEADAAALPGSERARALGRLALVRAEAQWLFNRLDEARAQLAVARAAFEPVGDGVGLGDAHLIEATVLDQIGGDRLGAVHRAEAAYAEAGDELRRRFAGTWAACIEATADPDAAKARWEGALQEAEALGHPGLATYVEACRATLAWRRGDPGAAIDCFMRGFEAAERSGQVQSAIISAQNIGIAFSLLNDYEGALTWADRARAMVAPTGWPYATGWCLMQTGSILVGLGRAEAAKALLLENMHELEAFAGSRNHALACQILGEAALQLEENEDALRWCEAALRSGRALAYPDLVSGSLRFMAQALSRLDRVDEARAAADEALAVAEGEHDWHRVATIRHGMAEIARRHGPVPADAPDGAVHHLEAALAAGARMSGFVPPPVWHAELAAAYEAAGDLAAALRCERAASQARAREQRTRAEQMASATLLRHRAERALAEAEHQRALALASDLRAELLETQAELEKERVQSLLIHAGKMVAIGRLAAGVVHEMSHPVGTVLLLAQALEARLAASPREVGDAVAALVGESRRLQQFIARLRDFARVEPLQLARHDLKEVVADARQLFAPRLALDRIAYAEEVPSVALTVDPQRLSLAVANLVFNAVDAIAGRGDGAIRIVAVVREGRVELAVEDNGPGLPATVQARLFEPFFTTKPEGKGLGLGLALSAESLAAMGGRIAAANRPQGGARFTIGLPAG